MLESLWTAVRLLAASALVFGAIALATKRGEAVEAGRRALHEIRINLSLYFLDALLVAPAIAVLVALIQSTVVRLSLSMASPATWMRLGELPVFIAAVFAGDLAGYWRHRLEHTRWLWPIHAVHHSDTDMSWLTLSRFHPFNRVTTEAVDIACLAMLGFPQWAIVANALVRHYYGELIHADVPWTFGALGDVFVSPVMHRWHHARDVQGAGSNFATVFSVFDRVFGTYYVPGPCTVPLGVTDAIAPGTVGQLLYPFIGWAERLRPAERQKESV